jgi:hypothetical protein
MRFPSRAASAAIVFCAALAAASTSAAAQASPPAGHAHGAAPMNHHMSGWKEMDAFHMLMMRTWHPAKESNDLKPIRAKADSMAAAAAGWAKAAVPTACDSKATRATISQVAAESRALATLVRRRASDARVKSALAALHERFETVEESCKPAHH